MYEHDTETSDFHYFNTIPWCAQHMRGANLVVRPPSCRTIQPSGENLLFGRTLNTAGTISALLEIFSNKRAGGDAAAASASATPHQDAGSLIDEAKWLLALGQDVNGYPGMLHGGVVAAILDELIGGMVPINRERGLIPAGSYFTAYLNTQYRRPVPTTSGALLGRARFVKVDLARGKVFAEATLEDSEGTVLASAEALFVRARGTKL
ncbi:thioesterase superfamily protein [Apiospora hydei]|uniref:Thioesterase superfamily protein n=1 Tax=Apiospora hydei TaxID=1337664 RepID=A0ABR1V8G1_9PEZI